MLADAVEGAAVAVEGFIVIDGCMVGDDNDEDEEEEEEVGEGRAESSRPPLSERSLYFAGRQPVNHVRFSTPAGASPPPVVVAAAAASFSAAAAAEDASCLSIALKSSLAARGDTGRVLSPVRFELLAIVVDAAA